MGAPTGLAGSRLQPQPYSPAAMTPGVPPAAGQAPGAPVMPRQSPVTPQAMPRYAQPSIRESPLGMGLQRFAMR